MPTIEKQIERSRKEILAYQRALDASSIVAITDHKGIITYVNANFCKISQYSPDELIGHTHSIINSGYHSRDFFTDLWSTIISGEIWKGEIRNRAKDGSYYWVDTTIVPFPGDDGKPRQYMSIRTDITTIKEARDRKYRLLFDNSHDGLMLWRSTGVMQEVNGAMCHMLGYSYDEMIRLTRADLVVPDAHLAEGLRTREATGHYEGPLRYWRKDGTIMEADVSSTNYYDELGRGFTLVSVRDMTEKLSAERELRDSEMKFRALTENNKDVIALSSSEGKIVYTSPSVRDLLGFEPEELTGTPATDLMHPDELEYNISVMAWLIRNPGESVQKIMRMRHKDGSWRWIDDTSTNQLGNPAVNAIVSNLRDVTERKKAEEELENLNQSLERKINERTHELRESNKALDSFTYMVAHDLQSPIRLQEGYASMLKEIYGSQLGAEGCELADIIIQSSRHMRQLVNDMLAFSRISHSVMKRENVSLDDLVSDVCSHLLSKDTHQHTKLEIADLGYCHCDPNLMRQAWVNLISNALKYSGKKEHPLIEIGAFTRAGEKVYFIRDNGAGFNPAFANKLFTVFQRLHPAGDFEGTGLGLAIVSNVIKRHGGRIWAEGEVDHGATFYFTLPEEDGK